MGCFQQEEKTKQSTRKPVVEFTGEEAPKGDGRW
ncbi:hypothetical protein KP509_07G031500 [Ceratopteris richardii]|uniref:Uncharacterized protein n=1 Tax=Ceratopteris richardii TaxID=49495 RepID=A0A8T2U9T5_CERRI|nr:hypothetical protein KP509_07G031500 [Ceratopteris richardii]